VLYGIYSVHLVRADARALGRLAPQLRRMLESDHDPSVQIILRNLLGVRDFFRAEYAAAREHFEAANTFVDARELAAQHTSLMQRYAFEGVLTSPLWLCWCDAWSGKLASATRRMQELEALADASGDAYLRCQTAAYLATLARDLGDRAEANRLGTKALVLASQHRLHFWLAFGLIVTGWVALESAPEQGLATVSQGLGILDMIGSLVNLGYFQSYLVECHRARGDLAQARATVDTALAACRDSIGPSYEPDLLRMKGELLADQGDLTGAEDHLRGSVAVARLQGVKLVELRGRVALAGLVRKLGRSAEAKDIVEQAIAAFPAGERGPDLDAAERLLGELRASAA
jgi:adenylate cyclase